MAAVAELLFMDLASSTSASSSNSKNTGGSATAAATSTQSHEASSQGLVQGPSPAAAAGGEFTLVLTAEASDHDEVLELLQLLVSWPSAAAMLCGVLGQGQRQRIEEVIREL